MHSTQLPLRRTLPYLPIDDLLIVFPTCIERSRLLAVWSADSLLRADDPSPAVRKYPEITADHLAQRMPRWMMITRQRE